MSISHPGFTLETVDFDPFATEGTSFPSTEAQREIFTSILIGGDAANCAFNESVTLRFSGPLDSTLLRKAFDAIVSRHEALRLTFNEDGMSFRIAEHLDLPWQEDSAATPQEGIALVDELIKQEVLRPFDIKNGPLIRMHLIKIDSYDHALLVSAHHLVCDGWSLSLILRDFSHIYSSFVKGEPTSLEPALLFSQYAQQNVAYKDSAQYAENESYWLKQFAGEVPVVEFPNDNSRPARRGFQARRVDVDVPEAVVAGLRHLSRSTKTSFVTLMLSAFEAYLYRITGLRELVVGLPSAGQSVEGQYNLVGHCVNLLPLCTLIVPEQSFIDYLKDRRAYLLDAYDHQQLTFGSLLQKLKIPRDPSRIPLIPVAFNVDIGFTEGFHFEGCSFKVATNPRFFENFEVFLNVSGDGDRLVLECTFNNDLFNRNMMRLRMDEFVRLLESLVEHPENPIRQLSLISTEEVARLEAINSTHVQHEGALGVHEAIDRVAATQKRSLAVVCGEQKMTYAELSELSDRFAAGLQALGLKPGAVVGVCLPRTVELPAVLLGIMKAGCAYMPLDPGFPADRLHYMMTDSNAPFVVITQAVQAQLGFDPARVVLFENLLKAPSATFHKTTVTHDSLAYILYTSGSTGQPKGIAIRHAGVTNLLYDLARKLRVGKGSKLLAMATISFDISVFDFFITLMHGAEVHIATKEQSMDPHWIAETIDKEAINFLLATPATYEMLLMVGWQGSKNLSALCGGEALRIELAQKLVSGCRDVWNLYGPTEITILCTFERITLNTPIRSRNGICAIGKPVANTRVYVMDEYGQPCPLGVSGELWIGGDGLAAGYVNRPQLNSEKFIPAPDGKGMVFRSGDRVQTDLTGTLYFLDRLDDQLKIRGFRIEAGEVETVLNASPLVSQSVVMGIRDVSGQTVLAAWLLPRDRTRNEEYLIGECKKALAEKLPDYMIPTAWKMMSSLPLTPSGKINRKALPNPLPTLPSPLASQVVPQVEEMNAMQQTVHALFKAILKVPIIRLDDNFFNLGGHSILAVKLMIDLEKATGKKLPLAVLFSSPTIRELSSVLMDANGDGLWEPIVPIRETGQRPPLYFAHGISGNILKYHALGLRLSQDQPSFGLQALGLNGKDKPFTSIREMAAYHVSAIKERHPKGPYHLLGGSFGGYLAYEMAVQLQAAGEKVGLLCVCDIEACKIQDFLPTGVKELVDVALLSTRFIKRAAELAMASKEERSAYFAERKKRSQGKVYDYWLDKHKMAEEIGHESTAVFQQIEEACYIALMSYKIPSYSGDMLLIRAKEDHFNNEYAYDLGWSNFAKGKVTVATVSGDHNSIFWEPHVADLIQVVDSALESYQGRG
ncbi:MAG: amino acid adenylation domain-containing protein [Betaproteobacteria bacterium]